MDGLDNEQRVEAWKSCWAKSLVGMAIVEKSGRFRAVNQQWVKILGVPATEFYGNTYQDITPISELQADEEQAKLVSQGLIDSYEMDKHYEFKNGQRVAIRLLVTRVPIYTEKPFMFYLSRIVPRKEVSAADAQTQQTLSVSQRQGSRATNDFLAQAIPFLMRYWVAIAVGSAALVGTISGVFNELFQMGFF